MKLVFQKAHNLQRLHEELLEAVDAIRPMVLADGTKQAVFMLCGDGQTVYLDVPDNLTPEQVAEIERVVNGHNPS